eukprot:jgi/Astpho2/5293/Aster-x1287
MDQIEEELATLLAIYGEDCLVKPEERSVEVYIPNRAAQAPLRLQVFLPINYPGRAAPVAELTGQRLLDGERSNVLQHLQQLFTPGEVVLFSWVEWLREQEHLWHDEESKQQQQAEEEEPTAGQAEPLAEAVGGTQLGPSSAGMSEADIVHGEAFTERKSTFQAHLAQVTSVKQVEAVMALLKQNNKIARATHNILAYRIKLPSLGSWISDADDDGEAQAGGRLLHLLQVVNASDVMVVVSRWYGGVLLGPARFQHINNAARDLLDKCGHVHTGPASGKAKGKNKDQP